MVGAFPVEGVLQKVVRGHVQERHPVRVHDDSVLACVASVEDDLVTVDPHDREVVLRTGHDVAAGIRACVEHDRVAGSSPGNRQLQSGNVLRDADLRSGDSRSCDRRRLTGGP